MCTDITWSASLVNFRTCCTPAKMETRSFLFSLAICFYFAFTLDITTAGGSCLLNVCLCAPYVVDCEDSINIRPRFTTNERLYVRHLKLRWDHVLWIKQMCDAFPRLEYVVFGYTQTVRSTRCPLLGTCGHLKVDCL